MSQYPPIRPWAALSAIDLEDEPGILYEDERQQWLRQHPHVAPRTAKKIGNKSLRPFADGGPSMAKNLRGIAERGAARRNGTAVNKNDVSTKPLPPIPQEAPQPASTAGQKNVFQGSGSDINKMSIHYVLNRSEMQRNQAETPFSQRGPSQPVTEAGQKAGVDGPAYSSEKMKLNLLFKECKQQGYDDKTPSIQPRGSELALPLTVPFSDDCYNAQVSDINQSFADRRLALAALCHDPVYEAPYAQPNSSPHRHGHSQSSWYEASPTGSEFTPDSQVAVTPSANPVPGINQENQFTEVQRPTIEELITLINREKENCRLAHGNHNPGSPSSAYHLDPPNSAFTNIFYADPNTGSDFPTPDFVIRNAQSPPFASPGTIRELTPTTPVGFPSLSHAQSPCPKGCCYWSEDEFDLESSASSKLQFDQERSASDTPPQESPVLPSSSPLFPSLEECYIRDSEIPSESEIGTTIASVHQLDWDNTAPDSPLLDSPPSPIRATPLPERRPSNLRACSYADVSRVGISPSPNIPHDPRLTTVTFRPDCMSSPTSYTNWLRPTDMNNVDQSLVPRQLNVTKKNPAFTMNVPIQNVSQHQTVVHVSGSSNGRYSHAASVVSNESNINNLSSNSTVSRTSQSPDASSSGGSEDSRGTKRKRFTKNLFGKKGYLGDNQFSRERRFKFIKGAIEKGHSTIGSIKGMILDENRALINPSKPSIVTDNTAPITLNTNVQSILYAEIENTITHAANEFLMKEYYDGHLSVSSLNRVKRRWERKNMPGVPEFHFDQTTQYKLISANREHLKFGKATNGLRPYAVLRNWKKICKNMSIRTFVAPDSVIKKHIHDILDLLEILNADECHIELIIALDAHVRGELKKHEVMQHYRDTQNSRNSRS
ncbi:hypothetical protein N7447_009807 [Penicillium robsamsonii]|uniref:uncharacterized protein n=1 Tax=Penicillium robsamsonii TaxID=1792511 RepID=UPI00254978DF|nr:uncharacterized protein N7447_009807 [Penicillium robsamsonii]KAJ5812784.1 hypothetical protein N7447_009807 [Penicillium robsamsonii]